jgi:hypothetical protein
LEIPETPKGCYKTTTQGRIKGQNILGVSGKKLPNKGAQTEIVPVSSE